MKLHVANYRENEKGVYYPRTVEINSLDDLKDAARFDHVAGQMKNDHRASDNFISADCIMFDLDNTHSDEPADWLQLGDVADAFPDVKFYAIYSRNHMKQKPKYKSGTNEILYYEAPRPKYHIYFPTQGDIDLETYTTIIMTMLGLFPYFDAAAAKGAQPFFGVQDPHGEDIGGDLTIDQYLQTIPKKEVADQLAGFLETETGAAMAEKKEFKRVLEYYNLQATTRAPDSGATATENYPDEMGWIESAEKQKSIDWLQNWAAANGVTLGKQYGINTTQHPNTTAFCVACPWEDEHSGGKWPENETVILVGAAGKFSFLCRHSHGARYGWKEYRQEIEARAAQRQPQAAVTTPQSDFNAAADNSPTEDTKQAEIEAQAATGQTPPAVGAADYLRAGMFDKDIEYFRKYRNRKMGLHSEIDKWLTLYPGLAILGGASSLGKTTFVVNMIDKLLERGETVLYFSLEQLPIEIITKSLARKLYESPTPPPLTNTDIKNGATCEELERARQEYSELAENYHIITGNFYTTAEDIRQYVENYRAHNGGENCRPVVVIDYLQLIAPPVGFRGGIREYTDQNLKTLKDMQKTNELFVVVVSSFNRNSNYDPVSYESFKETGMIEFTADYVWGLQLSIMDAENDDFYLTKGPKGGAKERPLHEKREKVHAAQTKIPKEVELVSLKNRNGKQVFKAFFQYYPQYDFYRETVDPNMFPGIRPEDYTPPDRR